MYTPLLEENLNVYFTSNYILAPQMEEKKKFSGFKSRHFILLRAVNCDIKSTYYEESKNTNFT